MYHIVNVIYCLQQLIQFRINILAFACEESNPIYKRELFTVSS